MREKNVGLMDLDLKDLDSLVFVSSFLLVLPLQVKFVKKKIS